MRHFDLIRHFEGLELHAYKDMGGVLTIGYGHTASVREGQVITSDQADRLLENDVGWAEAAVDRLVDVPLNANQRSALISFVFNIGSSDFAQSTLLKILNNGRYGAVPSELSRWIHVDKVPVNGLVRRREAEAALWQLPVEHFAPIERNTPRGLDEPTGPLGQLKDSRTLWASFTALVTTAIATFKEGVADLLGLASTAASSGYGWQILNFVEKAQPTVVLLLLLVVIYARIDDHRKGRR